VNSSTPGQVGWEVRSPSLWKVFASIYWREMLAGGVFKLLGDGVNVVGPLAIGLIVTYVTQVQDGTLVHHGVVVSEVYKTSHYPSSGVNALTFFRIKVINPGVPRQLYYVGWKEVLRNGWVVAVVALVAALAQSTFSQASSHLVAMEGIHVKAALQAMIYRKSLRLSSRTLAEDPPAATESTTTDGNPK
ncbi:ATP-binding cassette sub-family C member 9-like, partial [Homarus americanus]